MKSFGCFSVLLFMAGTAFTCKLSHSTIGTFFLIPGAMALPLQGNNIMDTTIDMKMKGSRNVRSRNDQDGDIMHMEDYGPMDPVPSSSKASVKPGPIQHGAPLLPYIPSPSPPPGGSGNVDHP
ncbi:unnamed protein product [Cuscuta epithymum]|uniref:Uncharacterized protein n=1 Tax=Cuscuta epithymum TaxID=186058 RepID=A0AAV0F982_9ASTE|nr:unnamed protein product [Cuscuta epithymum]